MVSETPLSAQGMCHCSFCGLPIRLLLSQLLAPPLQSSQDPKNQRATGAHLLHTQLCAQDRLNTSLYVNHFPHSLFSCQLLLVVSVSHKKKKNPLQSLQVAHQARVQVLQLRTAAWLALHPHHLCCSSRRKTTVTPKCCSPFLRNLAQMHDPSRSFFNQLPIQSPFKVPSHHFLIIPSICCIVPGN